MLGQFQSHHILRDQTPECGQEFGEEDDLDLRIVAVSYENFEQYPFYVFTTTMAKHCHEIRSVCFA